MQASSPRLARLARRRGHARLRGDDPRHRRGPDPRRRSVRGDPRSTTGGRSRSTATWLGSSARRANLRLPLDLEAVRADAYRLLAQAGAGPDHELLRIVVTRGGRRLLLTEPMPRSSRARPAGVGHLRADPDSRRRQVAVVRREHARRPARPRAGVRRGAARHPARPRARGADELDLLGQGRRAADAAARRAHPRLDHPRDRDRGHGRRRALVHARGAARRRRGVPGLDDARGPAGLRDRRPHVRRARPGHGADGRVGRGAGSPAAGRRDEPPSWAPTLDEGPHGDRQPPPVHQGGGGLPAAARARTRRC